MVKYYSQNVLFDVQSMCEKKLPNLCTLNIFNRIYSFLKTFFFLFISLSWTIMWTQRSFKVIIQFKIRITSLTHSAAKYFQKLAFKKKQTKKTTLNGYISKASASSESKLTFSESSFNFLQNRVVFCTL